MAIADHSEPVVETSKKLNVLVFIKEKKTALKHIAGIKYGKKAKEPTALANLDLLFLATAYPNKMPIVPQIRETQTETSKVRPKAD